MGYRENLFMERWRKRERGRCSRFIIGGRESPTWIHNSRDNLAKSCVILQGIIHVFRFLYGFFRSKCMLFLHRISFPTPQDMYTLLKALVIPCFVGGYNLLTPEWLEYSFRD